MPTYLRNLILLTVLPVWLGYMILDVLVFQSLPPYEVLLVPSLTVTAVASPGFLGRLAKRVVAKEEDEK